MPRVSRLNAPSPTLLPDELSAVQIALDAREEFLLSPCIFKPSRNAGKNNTFYSTLILSIYRAMFLNCFLFIIVFFIFITESVITSEKHWSKGNEQDFEVGSIRLRRDFLQLFLINCQRRTNTRHLNFAGRRSTGKHTTGYNILRFV